MYMVIPGCFETTTRTRKIENTIVYIYTYVDMVMVKMTNGSTFAPGTQNVNGSWIM